MPTNVTTTYPGVYIEELSNLSLSVSAGATAVPIFAASAENGTYAEATRFNSWLDFMASLEASVEAAENKRQEKWEGKVRQSPFKKDNPLHVSIRAYFENGGGYCYIVNTSSMAAEVPKFDDITLLVAAGEDIGSAVSTLCIPGNSLFAILDKPKEKAQNIESIEPEKKKSIKEKILQGNISVSGLVPNPSAAMYYPNLLADWAGTTEIPASAVMAGIYCSVDRERGVWKAPANVSLKGGLRPATKVTDTDQEGMTPDDGTAINAIREFRNLGTLVWGARTMSSGGTDWRYVPVRRLFDTAERDIKRAVRIAVFEPNTGSTWTRVKAAIESYLHNIWQMGGLMGSRPEEGYFVQVGEGITMTREHVLSGKMIVKVGMAAVRPAEFIILQFTQEVGQV